MTDKKVIILKNGEKYFFQDEPIKFKCSEFTTSSSLFNDKGQAILKDNLFCTAKCEFHIQELHANRTRTSKFNINFDSKDKESLANAIKSHKDNYGYNSLPPFIDDSFENTNYLRASASEECMTIVFEQHLIDQIIKKVKTLDKPTLTINISCYNLYTKESDRYSESDNLLYILENKFFSGFVCGLRIE